LKVLGIGGSEAEIDAAVLSEAGFGGCFERIHSRRDGAWIGIGLMVEDMLEHGMKNAGCFGFATK
jgi:hypothetical protein